MRILCLHGMGTNGDILATQTEMIRALLPAHYEYVFVDGELQCDAPDEIRDLFPGPNLSYHLTPTLAAVSEALEFVEEIVERDGPFDGVLGFSQGAALAASLILHRSMASITRPFRFAVFLCSGLPFTDLPDFGGDISARFQSDDCVRRMHPKLDAVRMDLPTVHVYGKQDVEYYKQSKNLVKFCSHRLCFEIEHAQGHEVPRSAEMAKDVAGAIEKVIQSLEFGH